MAGPESAPIKRIVQEAKEQKMLIDATQGRKTRAVIITDSNHVILTYLQAETIMALSYNSGDETVNLVKKDGTKKGEAYIIFRPVGCRQGHAP